MVRVFIPSRSAQRTAKRTVEKSSHCVRITSVPIVSAVVCVRSTCVNDRALTRVGSPRAAHIRQRLVQA